MATCGYHAADKGTSLLAPKQLRNKRKQFLAILELFSKDKKKPIGVM